ncbi:hypothetical protein HN371_20090 [Candidatus Poribacteria bacterium]|jgi:rhamnogalacturonan endolyase|nr:hypothetical protein [Candidatus Poribacteria bacterium]MBT5535706.1 hypothetical protein [Candidatus Poribacteria bacterium]MBT7098889.1 hypothetical protein [Candidatus Poribacteria bacterium]MBT7804163.1 hypothetical protein [Candidatus Poribacteria bacterium]
MSSPYVLLEDRFGDLDEGMFSAPVGAHTEYHYLPEAAPKGHWSVACFINPTSRAWHVEERDGHRAMVQTCENKASWTRPILVAGDALWTDYTVTARFAPDSRHGCSGIAFRYRNSRCYYFAGFDADGLRLSVIRHETAFHQRDERVLARADCAWDAGQEYELTVSANGSALRASVSGLADIAAEDTTFLRGRVALAADGPTVYTSLQVTATAAQSRTFGVMRSKVDRELDDLRADNPKPVVWRKVSTEGFGVGRNLRFGDLTGDGRPDVLVGQMIHHGPRDAYSELSCLTAMTFDGDILWRIGEPDPANYHLTNDVGFQIHDIDGDGRSEVVFCKDMMIHVVDGATGRLKLQAPTPESRPPADKFPRILGDCLFFCDLRGTGRPGDMIIKDRYWHLWALDDELRPLWDAACRTGHYPHAFDVDGDGRDELAIGYALLDHDGSVLWNNEDDMPDHADGLAVVDFLQDGSGPRILCAASDAGLFFTDLTGRVVKHHHIGHAQNPATARFRPDLPGLQTVCINFWGNQGILHFYDAQGDIYHHCEPNNFGSMCLPINWRGDGQEFFVHSANVQYGGMFDGWGRPVVMFPDDGHPDMCNAVLDITGDCRDEVVVWDQHEIWVYTQDGAAPTDRLYRPRRNPLYNYSNYQASVSLPGWDDAAS